MSGRRTSRLNDQIRDEVSDLIRRELRDPRLAEIVSITEVETAPDLASARVYVSVMGEEEEKARTLEALESASSFLRRELKRRLFVKSIPVLIFKRDDSIERGARLTALIHEAVEEPGESSEKP